MGIEWEQLYKLGTDVAGFALYHPARLAHRSHAATGWWAEAEEEFRTGRLVSFCTGSDREFTIKFIQRSLSPVEEEALVASQPFRYVVDDGRLYWDNTDCLPGEDQFENAEDDQHGWLELADGRYRITVYALDWFSLPEAERIAAGDVSHYVVRIEPVSFDDVPAPRAAPWLLASRSWHAARIAQQKTEE
jgi:hypothetical protein